MILGFINIPTAILGALAVAKSISGYAQGFSEVSEEAGLVYTQAEQVDPKPLLINHLQTGGAAAADYDKDGWVDLIVTRMFAPPILYRNMGPNKDGVVTFKDVTEGSGLEDKVNYKGGPENFNGVAWADLDRDGDLDIYMTAFYSTRHYLFINKGDNTFSEVGLIRGAALPVEISNIETGEGVHHGFSISMGDYDKNGWIDLHTTDWQILSNSPTYRQHNVLLKGLGPLAPGFFRNSTEEAGVELIGQEENPATQLFNKLGFSSSFVDLDNDGWQDLAVAADFKTSQLFWSNGASITEGPIHFTEGTEAAGTNKAENAMGSTFGDLDNDGDLDWFVSSLRDNRLYLNNGDRTFKEVSAERGLGDAGWGWGTSFLDYDNDADLDLIMTNGHEDLYGEYSINATVDRTYLWENIDGQFHDVSDAMGITDFKPGKGLVVFDYDNDGDHDIFIANTQTTPTLYRNDSVNSNSWLRINLKGIESNTLGLGARLYLKRSAESTPLYQQMIGGNNFLGQNEMTVHFGLGQGIEKVYSLEIDWPSGKRQILDAIPSNQELFVVEPSNLPQWLSTNFTEKELEDELISGDDADPDKDGRTNFFEYAFGTSPKKADSNALLLRLDTISDTLRTFIFEQAAEKTDVSYVYEASQDLKQWKEFEDYEFTRQVIEHKSDGKRLVKLTLNVPTSISPFIRIRAVEKQ